MRQEDISKIIREELNKQDVNNIISDKLNSFIRKSEFEKEVRNIVSDVFEKFFKLMYNKRGFWRNDIKNG